MINKKNWLGILVMILVFGIMVIEVSAQSNKGGEFTLTNIPAKYDGKYVILYGQDEDYDLKLLDGDSLKTVKIFRIVDGKVIISLWFYREEEIDFENDDEENNYYENKLVRYNGNHSLQVTVNVYDFLTSSQRLKQIQFMNADTSNKKFVGNSIVNFINGSATKSYNDRNKTKKIKNRFYCT